MHIARTFRSLRGEGRVSEILVRAGAESLPSHPSGTTAPHTLGPRSASPGRGSAEQALIAAGESVLERQP
jgi:hypothetical protein